MRWKFADVVICHIDTRIALASAVVALAVSLGCEPSSPAEPPAHSQALAPAGRCPSPGRLTGPSLIKSEPAVLTKEAMEAGVKGPAKAQCFVLANGTVAGCRLLDESSKYMYLAIEKAVKTWRFTPAFYNDQALAVPWTIEVPLVPPAPDAAPPPESAPDASGEKPPKKVVIPFGGSMNRPRMIAGAHPAYTMDARLACIQGTVLAKCVITTEGTLENCRVFKSLPYLDQAVLAAAATQRYTPILFNGVPVNVEYLLTFNFKLQ